MYCEFLANFACNLQHVSPTLRPVVYALDRRTQVFAAILGLSSVLLSNEGDDFRLVDFEKGRRSLNVIAKMKLVAVRNALKSGLDVLLSDSDIFWCADAVEVLKDMIMKYPYSDADVLIQPEAKYRMLSSGFYYVRTTERTVKLFTQLIVHIYIGPHDQDVINRVFCDPVFGGQRIYEQYGDVPYRCESRGVVVRMLPADQFLSGTEEYEGVKIFSHSKQKLADMCALGRFVVLHNNFIRATKKKARFVQKGMWFVLFGDNKQPRCMNEALPESDVALRTCAPYC